MTEKELKQYRSIVKEIEEERIYLKENSVNDVIKGSETEFPFTCHTLKISGVGNNYDSYARIERLEYQKRCIEDFIYSIDDSLTRRIFEHRYIKGNTMPSWKVIAFKIGKYEESYPRKKHNNFMKMK